MTHSNGLYVVALTQLILACVMAWKWFVGGDGGDLVWAVISALLTILCVVIGYRFRNSPAWPKSDPRVLRRIASVGGVTGTLALIALVWRVHGDWILLGEATNLVLAIFSIFGLGYAASAALLLKDLVDRERRTPS